MLSSLVSIKGQAGVWSRNVLVLKSVPNLSFCSLSSLSSDRAEPSVVRDGSLPGRGGVQPPVQPIWLDLHQRQRTHQDRNGNLQYTIIYAANPSQHHVGIFSMSAHTWNGIWQHYSHVRPNHKVHQVTHWHTGGNSESTAPDFQKLCHTAILFHHS